MDYISFLMGWEKKKHLMMTGKEAEEEKRHLTEITKEAQKSAEIYWEKHRT